MRSVKQPATLPVLALTAWLAMPAHAADGEFALSQDFLSAEPAHARNLPGTDLRNIKKMPAQTLRQLMASARGQLPLERKTPLVPLVLNPAAINGEQPQKPLVYVTGPNTKHQLTPVTLPDAMQARAKEEEEILREAEAALKMDLPDEDLAPRPLPMKKAPNAVASVKIPYALPSMETRTKPAVKHQGNTLVLQDVGGELQIVPKALSLSMLDDGVSVVDNDLAPQIFVRDTQAKVVSWHAGQKQLTARGKGRTELYITYRNQLYIVPIEVKGGIDPKAKGSAQEDSLLADLPTSFQKLTSVMPLMEQPYASYGYNEIPSQAAAPEDKPKEKREPLTLSTSVAQVQATRDRMVEQQARFFYPNSDPDYRTLDVQVMDERSTPESAEIFPVSGLSVRIVGTRLKAQSSANGHAKFGEIPDGSRFFVEIQDEKNGQVIPTISEVALYRGGRDEVLRARTMKYSTYSRYLDILDIAQDTGKSSFCARLMSEDGRTPLAGYRVSINVKDSEIKGPYYVNNLGAPDLRLHHTDDLGRFCYFNVPSGLVEMKVHTARGAGYLTSLSMPLFPGAHTEEDLPLNDDDAGRVVLAAMPSATDEIYEERSAVEQPLQPVDYVDMVTVGNNESMARVGNSVVGYQGGTTLFKGRLYTAVSAAEFEPTLYTFDRDKQARKSLQVAPLLQRGYIQDIFHELAAQDNTSSVAFDPSRGAVIVLHHGEKDAGSVNVSLVDSYGHVLNEGWSFGNSSQGLSRTVFFNLNPGIYSVVVDNGQGAILGLDTIAVDFWTASVVQTGSSAHFNLQQARRED